MWLSSAAVLASAWSVGVLSESTGWDRLETTWAMLAWDGFFSVPTSMSEAKSQGWDMVSSCDNDAQMGALFAFEGDLSSMPFFDENTGQLLGISLGVWQVGQDSLQSGQPWMQHSLNNGSDYFAVQFAFQNPSLICSDANTNPTDPSSSSIGAGLWVRQANNGTAQDWFQPPLQRNATALADLGYVMGKCFPQMGVSRALCALVSTQLGWDVQQANTGGGTTTLPTSAARTYNSGKLNAFGIALGQPDFPYQSSKRWEHPKGTDTEIFFADGLWPTCLDTSRVLSTQHVYLNNPAWMDCL